MMSLALRPNFESTSAAGAMRLGRKSDTNLIGSMLTGQGTSAVYVAPRSVELRSYRSIGQTTSGVEVIVPSFAGAAIGELRRLSGLTWEQLARMFGVSRRSLHFWASGRAMASNHEERLQRVLAVVQTIDRGSASVNRAALLGVREDGRLPFDLLAAGEYERVLSLLGRGDARRVSPPHRVDGKRIARAPRPPEELVGALQDRIHRESGLFRAAKSARVRSGR